MTEEVRLCAISRPRPPNPIIGRGPATADDVTYDKPIMANYIEVERTNGNTNNLYTAIVLPIYLLLVRYIHYMCVYTCIYII